jgi:adenine deaminase
MNHLPRLLAVARGDEVADVVLTGGRIVNTFSGEIEDGLDVAIAGDHIAGVGAGYSGKERIDLKGAYLAPGLIDAHVHIESSMCTPAQFARALLPRGVTSVVADPHEIANVAGVEGVRYIAEASKHLLLDVTIMAPSCVPATEMATAGATLSAGELHELRSAEITYGLGEVMNFPGVISGQRDMLEKISAMSGRPLDCHAPGVSGKRLNSYIAAGMGSDHECVTSDEAREKLSRGMYVLIREATNARNLDALLPIITSANSRRICFCTDDRTPVELLQKGSVDEMVRRAIAFGIEPVEAIRMATLNPADWFGLRHLGAIAPGRLASLFAFEDLNRPEAQVVFARGRRISREAVDAGATPAPPLGRCEVKWDTIRWDVPARSHRVRVIGSTPDQLVTEHRILSAKIEAGNAVADVSRDILKMMVIERHGKTNNSGVGFIQGFGLQSGAIAGTVAHDHHNLVCIGADDLSMQSAARAAASAGGGLAVAVGERVLAQLPLPVGGLMSEESIESVAEGYAAVVNAGRGLGSMLSDPFMAMSFMALEVIPSLKLTDQGLVDVEQFRIVDLFV